MTQTGPRRRARCFVAIWPDEPTTTALRTLPRPTADGVRWVRPEDWHITLRFLGDVDIGAVVDALAGVALPRADITLGPAVTMLGGRQAVLPVTGADALSELVDDVTAPIGERRRHPFVGHLTLARVRPPASPELLGHRFEVSFPVGEIAVAASELLATGARYERVATVAAPTR